MGSLFGGGTDSTDEMLQMQKDEAAQARVKEEERKARINAGLSRINAMFSPQGEEGTVKKTFDWKTFNPATARAGAVPGMSGFNFVKQADTPATAAVYGPAAYIRRGGDDTGSGQQARGGGPQGALVTPATAAIPGGWAVKGPDGKIYKQGDAVSGVVGTGKYEGGFDDDFFNKLRSGIEGYYQPQVAEKYGQAKDETNYRLARAGLLQSSAASSALADLAKQNDIQVGNVRQKADEGAAGLKKQVQAEKTNAVNQLYSTENPDVAINQATGAIRNITAAPTDLTPLGAIFDIATIGASKFAQGAQNAAATKRWGALPNSSGRVVGA